MAQSQGSSSQRRARRFEQAPSIRRETSEFDRGLSFFDAIYGFAVTLLIANMAAPRRRDWQSVSALLDSGILGQLGAFALSFVVITLFWRVNVQLVQQLREMDSVTVVANLVAAGFVILIPFTSQGIADGQLAGLVLPTVLYAFNIIAASLSQTMMFQVARFRGLENEPMSSRANRAWVLDNLAPVSVFLVSIPVALVWGGSAGKLSWLLLILIGPLSARLTAKAKSGG